jgi:hypothetical protein
VFRVEGFYGCFLLGLFFHLEDGDNVFLRNFGYLSWDHTELFTTTAVRT